MTSSARAATGHTRSTSPRPQFILAGTGRQVAKHGNRGGLVPVRLGGCLSALGVNLDLTPEQVAQAIEEIGIGFMFAPKFHPAMKHAIGPRKEIGQRTIFNISVRSPTLPARISS